MCSTFSPSSSAKLDHNTAGSELGVVGVCMNKLLLAKCLRYALGGERGYRSLISIPTQAYEYRTVNVYITQ